MSATNKNKSEWFWSDWLGDQEVRRLTPAERGIWIDLIALAAHGIPKGYVCDAHGRPLSLEEIARVTNAGSPDAAAELIAGILEKGACSRDRAGRLFNRRMVRDTEKARKVAELSAKRSDAGFNGAAHMHLKYFGKQILPRQMPRQLPRQAHGKSGIPYLKNKKNLTSDSEYVAARASPKASAQAPDGETNPQGSLATAPPDGALASPATAVPGSSGSPTKGKMDASPQLAQTIHAKGWAK